MEVGALVLIDYGTPLCWFQGEGWGPFNLA